MEAEGEKSGGGDWTAIAARVAKSHGIDRFGMTKQRLNILVALGQLGPIAKGRMCDFAQCQIEELEKFVMPALIVCTAAEPAMVAVTTQGYQITWRGIRELKRRGIPHRGAKVVADGIHRLDFGNYDPGRFWGLSHEGGRLPDADWCCSWCCCRWCWQCRRWCSSFSLGSCSPHIT